MAPTDQVPPASATSFADELRASQQPQLSRKQLKKLARQQKHQGAVKAQAPQLAPVIQITSQPPQGPVSVSIITPTHNTKQLKRLYESIKTQSSMPLEWVIVPNGDLKKTTCAAELGLPQEPWIKVVPLLLDATNIGMIKQFAFMQGKGDWLLEVDHDDELHPNAVKKIQENAHKADFLYSDCLELNENGTHNEYKGNGWSYYDYVWAGKPVKVAHAFPATPQALSRIYYAPNHFRAWKRDFYSKIGGHNGTMPALDDQELLIRTFMQGTMFHIPEPLYIYHMHKENSSKGNLNAWIQKTTVELYDQWIYKLMERWCELKGLTKLDLCGGIDKPKGYTSIDLEGADINWDMNQVPWPIPSGSVGVVRAHDALEHLKDSIATMAEIHRILAPGGMLLSSTPSTDGRGAFQDPTHVSFWNSNKFWYWTKNTGKKYGNSYSKNARFQLTRALDTYYTPWHELHKISYCIAHLTKLDGSKDENMYAPGAIEI